MESLEVMEDEKPSIQALRASVAAYTARVKTEWAEGNPEQDYGGSSYQKVSEPSTIEENEEHTVEELSYIAEPKASSSLQEREVCFSKT
ncbi:hypothetical protein ElyMa_005930100 [Elysia marginata]|uniref:Uncharacterized protein n=1 Tax=Elysia marginata TaxID=1093978 RepID=A0AAV4GAE2_9GAST|nr:hypothetical protein ElyMa_005930100 [Elysia marginata]